MADEFHEGDPFEDGDEAAPLDEHELELVEQDLDDLADFEATFAGEGYRGVSVWCHDCVEEHYYPWDMLRENLTMLLETGETPVHEPAFAPEPRHYINWEYARGYIDALRDAGVRTPEIVSACHRCGLRFGEEFGSSNFCPRCGATLVGPRLREVLAKQGLDDQQVQTIMRAVGL